jgi:hypothetical protein
MPICFAKALEVLANRVTAKGSGITVDIRGTSGNVFKYHR